MNKVRERVKFNVPAVVLTLLGIVQAFALELLWCFLQSCGRWKFGGPAQFGMSRAFVG